MASPFDKFLIAPLNTGLQTDVEPWLIPDDAFESLNNAYILNGKLKKRFGSTYTGYGYSSDLTEQLFSRLRIGLLSSSASVGTTNGVTGNLSGTVAGASGAIGQQFVIGAEVFTVAVLGTPGIMTTTGAATIHTFNTTTGAFVIEGAALATECFFYSSGIGTTRADGSATGIVPGAIFKVGQMFSIGTEIYTVSVLGTPGIMLASSGTATVFTFNTTTGAYVFTGADASKQIYFYPSEPVMGLTQYESDAINDRPAIAFDTQYAYKYSGGSWGFSGPTLPKRWNGGNADFFNSTRWRGLKAENSILFTSNYHADVPTAVDTDDPIRYYDGTIWTDFSFETIVGGNKILTSKIIIPFKDRLVLLSTIEQNTGGTVNTEFKNRCRYSHNGSPLDTNAWLEKNQVGYTGGGWIDAATKEQIMSAELIRDRLIVYFEQSTWEIVYTGNQVLPFLWKQINPELGSQSMNSTIQLNRSIATIGSRGIHECNGANVERIDRKIPKEVFKISTDNNGIDRVAGIRDFYTEMLYWSFPKSNAEEYADVYPNKVLVYNYKNGSWAFNDDCITAFGSFEQQEDVTWESLGDLTWKESDRAWDSGVMQADFKQVIAGNQQGFVFVIAPDVTTNAHVMQVSKVSYADSGDSVLITLTIKDHTIKNSEYIKLANMTGLTISGNGIYSITIVDADTITILVKTCTGTYLGGGTVARVSKIDILSKQWNFYMKEAANIYLSQIDFIVKRTSAGKVTVNYYPSTSSLDLIDEATTTDTLIGTNILETSAYTLEPFEQTQDRLIHRVYFAGEGNCVQIHIYLSPTQTMDPSIVESDFQLEGMIVYTMKTGGF